LLYKNETREECISKGDPAIAEQNIIPFALKEKRRV